MCTKVHLYILIFLLLSPSLSLSPLSLLSLSSLPISLSLSLPPFSLSPSIPLPLSLSLFLSVFQSLPDLVDDKNMLEFIRNKTAAPYFTNLVWFIGNHVIELDSCLMHTKYTKQIRSVCYCF